MTEQTIVPDVLPDDSSDWGIRPIPRARRVLSGFDLAILWGDLGIGLLVLVTGALLVPALGFLSAFTAIVVGSVIGCALLGLVAMAGADHGVPTMVLLRPVLGIRGSWIPSLLNAVQLVGWTAVELWAMSFVADIVGRQVFGFSAQSLWLAVAAVICTGLALWGPVGVTQVWMKRFGAWLITGICLLVTVLTLTSGGVAELLTAPGQGGWPTFGAAVDLVIAMPISWLPLVADYTRFARRPRGALGGTFVGYLVANIWLYTLGCLLVLATQAAPDPAGVAGAILAIAGGSVAGILFLAGLLAGETDEAFADMYSGAVCLQNIWPRLSRRGTTLAIALLATVLAAWLTIELYESFLFLIGSVFVPLFGIMAAEYFVRRRRVLHSEDLYADDGAYWFTGGFNILSLVPWVAGFLVYHWIAPTGPAWWVAGLGDIAGEPLSSKLPWLAASLPSFATGFLLSLALSGRSAPPNSLGTGGRERLSSFEAKQEKGDG